MNLVEGRFWVPRLLIIFITPLPTQLQQFDNLFVVASTLICLFVVLWRFV